jgi:hypothetical protein
LRIVGRRNLWRIGRAFYLSARADYSNFIESNGEKRLQREYLGSLSPNKEKIVVFDIGANVGEWSIALFDNCMYLELSYFE